MADDAITRIDVSESASNAGYLFNVGDFMLAFSTVAGTTVLATIVYGTREFRPHNALEAALQFVITAAALGYVPLVAWRGYERRYWRGHFVLGSLLVGGILAGIPAVILEGWEWSWTSTIAFAIFVVIFTMLAAIPLGFALTARELLVARASVDGPLLVDIVAESSADPTAGRVRAADRARFSILGSTLILAGVAGIASVVVLFAVYGLANERDARLAESALDALAPLIFTLPVSAILIYVGRRLSQPNASRLLQIDERSPILLLRSFADDAKQIRAKGLAMRVLFLGMLGRKRLEAAIADELSRLGPFIAIGQPGERLPRLGAARAYFSDDEWQSAVIDWISRARLIVMIAGRTPWVQWELRQIVRAGQLGKLLLLLPPGPAEDRRHRIELICEALDDRRLASADVNLQRSVAVRFFAAKDPDRHQPSIVVVESTELTEVGYELGVRVATSTADQLCR